MVHIGNKAFVHLFYVVQNAYKKQEEDHQRNDGINVNAADGGCVAFDVFEHVRWIYDLGFTMYDCRLAIDLDFGFALL